MLGYSHGFSRVWRHLHVFASSFDWLTGFFCASVISTAVFNRVSYIVKT